MYCCRKIKTLLTRSPGFGTIQKFGGEFNIFTFLQHIAKHHIDVPNSKGGFGDPNGEEVVKEKPKDVESILDYDDCILDDFIMYQTDLNWENRLEGKSSEDDQLVKANG